VVDEAAGLPTNKLAPCVLDVGKEIGSKATTVEEATACPAVSQLTKTHTPSQSLLTL
jgi:hypothetical protein